MYRAERFNKTLPILTNLHTTTYVFSKKKKKKEKKRYGCRGV